MRGFLGGIGLGAVVAVLFAATISLVRPLPEPPKVADQAPEDVSAPQTDQSAEMEKPAGDADLVEAAPVGPKDGKVPSDSLSALQDADIQPADKPEIGAATGALGEPEETGSTPSVSGTADKPVTSTDPSVAPTAPAPEATASISTEPAQPPAPKLFDEDTGFGPDEAEDPKAPEAPEAPKAPVVDESAPELTQTTPEQPEPDTASVAEPEQDPVPVAEPEPDQADAKPEAEPAPVKSASVEPGTGTEPEPQPESQPDPQDDASPRVSGLPQTGTENTTLSPGIGKKVVPLTERGTPIEQAQEQVQIGEPEPAAPVGKPIEAFAEPFENPDERPLMSILLIDDGTSLGVEALQDFPYPLSIALDPRSPDAKDRMDRYRAAGFEVALIADMDANARPQDVETTLPLWMERLPEAVAVLEGTGSGIQGNRGLSDQVTEVAQAMGLGLITQNSGLNTVQKLALRDGVPSATVFRDFDGAGQTPAVIRRFLDQAAFRAGQEGAVIMLGRVRPDTISALLLWGLQDRASRVALAPISASLVSNLP